MIVFPNFISGNDFDKAYLISSNHNQFGGIIIPGLIASIGVLQFKNNSKSFIVMLLLSLFMVLYTGSMTSTCSLVLILCYYLIVSKNKKLSKLAIIAICLATAFFFFDVVFTSMTESLTFDGIIDKFITAIGKDSTFTGRTKVWLLAFAHYLQEPIYGMGHYDMDWAKTYLDVHNTHNIILNILLQGGLVLLAFIIISVGILIRSVASINTHQSRLALFTICVYLFMMQLEVYGYFMIALSLLELYLITIAYKYE